MQQYLMLSRGNFYAEKQRSNKVLPFGAMESGNIIFVCNNLYSPSHGSSKQSNNLLLIIIIS